jgi:hypothetical protein
MTDKTPAKSVEKAPVEKAEKSEKAPVEKPEKVKKVPKSLVEDIKQLFKVASSRGYVTQDEILDVFVEPEIYVEELDDLYDRFFKSSRQSGRIYIGSQSLCCEIICFLT